MNIFSNDDEEKEAVVHEMDYHITREIWLDYEFGATIRGVLLHKIFGAGLHLYSNESVIELNERERTDFLDQWITLGRKIFDEWYMLGVVPYRWQWHKERNVMQPVILTETLGWTYRLKVYTTDQGKRYEYYAKYATEPDKDVFFLDLFDAAPTMHGRLTSPVSHLQDLYFTLAVLNALKMKADTLKATPQLVASTAEPAVPAHMQNAMAASALFRQGAALEAAKDSGSAALYAQIQRQAVENRQRVTDQYRYLQSSSSGTVNFKDIWASFVHNTPSVITLNDKQTITPAPPSSEPEHYVETQQTLRQAMAAAMQVPYAILMGDTTSRTAATATDLTLPTFTRNIVALKQKMGEVMTQLFREMMLRTQAELLRRHRRKNKNKQKPARDVLEKKFTKETWGDLNPDAFKMSLIHNDIQDPAALAFLYVARALDYPSYIHERLSSIPFNQTQRDIIEVTVKALPDPLTDAEKLELVKAAFAQILGVASPIDARQADMETRDGMTTLSLGTRAKRKRSEQSSSRSGEVTEPTAANVRS